MKVLFAVSNERMSASIVKQYQKEYKQIISYKNVYYFNAILKELQKDKTYDRVVISEDLEQFTNNDYEQMDKFIFDRLDSISDEASNQSGADIPIILICSERRTKGEQILVKLFGIGIYNAIIGNDRSISEVCKLINRPRVKKEAKVYYRIDSDEVNYQAENENDVSELEIQNILAHYKRIGYDEERYVESFNSIASQYNDVQLRIISKFLPLNVRAVLEEKSPKYQAINSFNNSVSNNVRVKKKEEKTGPSEKLLTNDKPVLTGPVVIPSAINKDKVQKVKKTVTPVQTTITDRQASKNTVQQNDLDDLEDLVVEPERIKRVSNQEIEVKPEIVQEPEIEEIENIEEPIIEETPKRKRGRPRKNPLPVETEEVPKKKRGRPRKNPLPETIEDEEEMILPGIEENEEEVIEPKKTSYEAEEKDEDYFLPGIEEEQEEEEDDFLPGLDETQEEDSFLPGIEQVEEKDDFLPGFEEVSKEEEEDDFFNVKPTNVANSVVRRDVQPSNETDVPELNMDELLTKGQKIVAFLGTSKNGTSFLLNNVAEILSSMGVNTAILDLTKNRNAYYIYTKNEEELRNTSYYCINNLKKGNTTGIKVNRNLTVYTSLLDENNTLDNAEAIVETLVRNYTVVLMDCDFSTPLNYFKYAQELYLIQSLDILTIQPLTAFLNELKSKNILKEEKIRIVINKYIKTRELTEKTIIGGLAFYNDPAMLYMKELFDRSKVKYMTIPFDMDVYQKYLEGVVNCEISLKGYSKQFIQILKQLANMIYPTQKGTYTPPSVKQNSTFSPSMNSTLNQMKQRY